MKTILRSKNFENNILEIYHNKDFKNKSFEEEIMNIDTRYEKGVFKFISLNGVKITLREITLEDYQIHVSHDFPFFKLHFEMEGYSNYDPLNKKSTEVNIPNGHYNLFYLPEVNGILSYKAPRRKTLEIEFTEHYIKKILGVNFKKVLHKLGKAISSETPFLMWKKSQPISNDLQSHINEIANCNYPIELKKHYLEAKIKELLIFLLAKTNLNTRQNSFDLTEDSYTKILKVETYIKENLNNSLTINELSMYAGVNTTKLKNDFKIVFSTSIFKFITKLRMEKAKNLIIENNYTIAEASREIGYKHQQHFTLAFKKTYGLLPSELKNKTTIQ